MDTSQQNLLMKFAEVLHTVRHQFLRDLIQHMRCVRWTQAVSTCPPKMYSMSSTVVIVAPLRGTSLPLALQQKCCHAIKMAACIMHARALHVAAHVRLSELYRMADRSPLSICSWLNACPLIGMSACNCSTLVS